MSCDSLPPSLQYENQTEGLQSSLREKELQKQEVEQALERLNEQLVALRRREPLLQAAAHDRQQEESRRVLEEQLQEQLEVHQRQMAAIRAEIANKECLMSQMQQ